MRSVRASALGLVIALAVATAATAASEALLRVNGVGVRAPDGWDLVTPAGAGPDTDPRTVLVAGTEGVVPRRSECHVAAYRVPADGAVIVVLRSAGKAPESFPTDRDALADLRLRREYFECFDGRGVAAQIAIRGRAYQVNLMVGDRATVRDVEQAFAVVRSFDVVR
jgi:hypothetical protein